MSHLWISLLRLSLPFFPASLVQNCCLPSQKYEDTWEFKDGKIRHFPTSVTCVELAAPMAQQITRSVMMANDVSSVFYTFLLQLSKSLLLKKFSHVDDFSVVLALNENLRQIDLSSLESISGGGVLYFNNPKLCYVGNFSTYLENQTTQHQCIISPFRKDPQACSESCDYHL